MFLFFQVQRSLLVVFLRRFDSSRKSNSLLLRNLNQSFRRILLFGRQLKEFMHHLGVLSSLSESCISMACLFTLFDVLEGMLSVFGILLG